MNRYTLRTGALEIVMITVAIIFFIPVYVLVNLSLKRPNDPGTPMQLVTDVTFSNYVEAWNQAQLGPALVTSSIITVVSTVLIIVFAAFAAYPLARVGKTWSSLAFYGFLVGLLLPFQLALIPLYQTMRDLGLLGNPLSLILFYVGSQMPFSMFLYVSFLRSVPAEYEEAASIDGAGPIATFLHVVFPLLRPITGTVAILNVLHIWNDFLTPLLYLSGSSSQTVPVALFAFLGQYVSQWNMVFAGLVISIAPVLVVYFLMQKSIIQGFASGLKG